jgi:hypothetical protein
VKLGLYGVKKMSHEYVELGSIGRRLTRSNPPPELDNQIVYTLVFLSPFDDNNQEELDKVITIENARNELYRIYRTQPGEPIEHNPIRHLSQDVDWLFGETQSKELTRREFLITAISAILKTIGKTLKMHFSLFLSRDADEIFCKIWVNETWLRQQAEELNYKLQFKHNYDYDPNAEGFKRVAPYHAFETENRGAVSNSESLFQMYDNHDDEIPNDGSLFTYRDKVRLVGNILYTTFDFNMMKEYGVFKEDLCIHDKKARKHLKEHWGSIKSIFKRQPISTIRKYFGEKVSLYYAWIGAYFTAMSIAALVGVLVFSLLFVFPTDNSSDSINPNQILQIVFCFFLAIWSSIFDQIWVRKEKVYAWEWGTVNFYEEEQQRGDFKGIFRKDEVTGRMKKHRESPFAYRLRKMVSMLVSIIFIAIVICVETFIFKLKNTLDAGAGPYVAGIIFAIQIRILNWIYSLIARWMNNWGKRYCRKS